MGTGSSTQVHAIHLSERPDDDADEDASYFFKKKERKSSQKGHPKNSQLDEEMNKIQKLEEMLAESEGQRLDLEERLENLQETVDMFTSTAEMNMNAQSSMQAKEEHLVLMQRDCLNLQKLISQLKLKHKQRIKKLNAHLAEKKQEMSIQHFELKSQIDKLSEDNQELKRQLGIHDEEAAATAGQQRIDLVIELSARVSEQSHQISTLEMIVTEKDKIIRRLERARQSEAGSQTSGIESLTSLSIESNPCHVNELDKIIRQLPPYSIGGSNSVLNLGEQKRRNGGLDKKSDTNGKKSGNNNSESHEVTQKDSFTSLLSDSVSDSDSDSEWSQGKNDSAPPQFSEDHNKRGHTAKSDKTKDPKSKPLVKVFGKDAVFDGNLI